MKSFLEQCAEYLHQKYGDSISELCMVFPSRRAGLFFKTRLAKVLNKTFFAPEVYTSEDFIQKMAGVEIIDNLSLLFEFYEVYKAHEKEKAETFDEFVSWAQLLLEDFNETDRYLVNAKGLFGYLNESYALQTWNVDGRQPSEFQKNYLHFWKSIGSYYHLLKEHLQRKSKAYPGLAYRMVAEGIDLEKAVKDYKKIIIVGFNALNAAEEKIFGALVASGRAEMLWDTDDYYMDHQVQEAGKFLRKYTKTLKPIPLKGDTKNSSEKDKLVFEADTHHFSKDKKEITIIGMPQNIGQTKYAGELLSKITDTSQLQSTAVVLADEGLLVPMLYAIPQNIPHVNVTMGYPLRNSPLSALFDGILALYENARRYGSKDENKQLAFYHKDIARILNNPFIHQLCNEDEEASVVAVLLAAIRDNNHVFLTASKLHSLLTKQEQEKYRAIEFIFNDTSGANSSGKGMLACFEQLVEQLRQLFFKDDAEASPVDIEFLFAYSKIIKRLDGLLQEHATNWELKTFRSVFNQLADVATIPFFGEPLRGLQLMGILETRVLDFDTVILLSTNEGFLPSGRKQQSFIPFDVKRAFGLPLYNDRDAIFAYHFYRLLQRAGTIYLLYNTETNDFNSGEKSRFITQLIQELPLVNKNVTIKEQLLSTPVIQTTYDPTISIPKTPEIQEQLKALAEKGFSPSSLTIFKNCPLQFYFYHVAKLRPQEEVEENIEAASLGTVIHDTLENLYSPFIGKKITVADFKAMISLVESAVITSFLKMYSEQDISYGKNHLTFKMVQRLVANLLEQELNTLENDKHILFIKDLEKEMETLVEPIAGLQIKLKGKIDRVDTMNGNTRIIDYKTGRVENRELQVKDWNELLDEKETNKAFQLLTYAYLFKKNNTMSSTLFPSIISFRSINEGPKQLKIEGVSNGVDDGVLAQYEKQLFILLNRVFDFKEPFYQTEDLTTCEYCPFINICERN